MGVHKEVMAPKSALAAPKAQELFKKPT